MHFAAHGQQYTWAAEANGMCWQCSTATYLVGPGPVTTAHVQVLARLVLRDFSLPRQEGYSSQMLILVGTCTWGLLPALSRAQSCKRSYSN